MARTDIGFLSQLTSVARLRALVALRERRRKLVYRLKHSSCGAWSDRS